MKSINLMRLPFSTVQEMWKELKLDFPTMTAVGVRDLLDEDHDVLGPLVVRWLVKHEQRWWASVQVKQPNGLYEFWVLTYQDTPDADRMPVKLERYLSHGQCMDEIAHRTTLKLPELLDATHDSQVKYVLEDAVWNFPDEEAERGNVPSNVVPFHKH